MAASDSKEFLNAKTAELIGKAALRKASWRMIPLLGLGYGIAFMDRINISFASLQMNRDLHFSATVYGFGAGLFFLAYAVCEVPSNLLLYRFGARRWLARIMLTWGLLAMGMMLVRTPVEFYAMRFLLGMAEAGFFPGVIFYLSEWFPARMRARVISRFYIAYPLASTFTGVVASPLLRLQGRLGLAGWQWLFLLEGLPAVLFSAVFLRYLTDRPKDAMWLSVEEREWLVGEMASQPVDRGHGENVWKMLRDPRVWTIAGIFLCMLTASYAYQLSAPAILQGATGLGVSGVGWVVAGGGLLGAAAMLGNAAHSDRSGERRWHVAVPFVLMSVMFAASGLMRIPWVVAGALTVVSACNAGLQTPLLALPATFLRGKSMAAGIAAMNTLGMMGGFLGPWVMGVVKDHTGNYRLGLVALVVPSLVGAALVLTLRVRGRVRVVVGVVAEGESF
jgi:ACS family tartrate transporter-like MFS transporter